MKFLLYRAAGAPAWTALADAADWPTATGLASGDYEAAAVEVAPVTVSVTALISPPADFAPEDWELVGITSAGADRLALSVLSLPDDGGSTLTGLEWRLDGGTAQALPASIAQHEITVTAEQEASVEIRALNTASPGPWSAPKTATPLPEWPQDTAAVWLILGQSNADGWAPLAQDPAKSDPAAAVVALTDAERADHAWIRYTAAGSTEPTQAGIFTPRRIAPPVGEPRSASKLWSDPGAASLGIPDATPGFGPEIGLVRYVLSDPGGAGWGEAAADPRLYLLKGVQGGTRVDALRYGGPVDVASFGAIRQTATNALSGLAAARPVLLQGIIVCIGGTDANTINPATGESMAPSYPRRMKEWIRSLRGLLSLDLPVALLPSVDNGYPPRQQVIAGLATIAADLPNCHVADAGPATDVGDGNHHDAATMSHLGREGFRLLRENHGRPGDGLVTGHPFSGFRPAFLVHPHLVDEFGTSAKLATVSSLHAKMHGVVLPPGAPTPTAEAIRDAGSSPLPNQVSAFTKFDLQPDVLFEGPTGAGTLQANETHDLLLALEVTDGSGRLSDVARVTRAGAAKQASVTATPTAGGGVTLSATVTPRGTWSWAIHDPANVPPSLTPEDVADVAFCPAPNEPDIYCAAGVVEATSYNQAMTASASGLSPGKGYVAFFTLRAAADLSDADLAGRFSPSYRVPFTAIA